MKPIGKVTHYYGRLGVAIVVLEDELKVGDRIRIQRGENFFDQEAKSIEKEYQQVESAKAGDSIGLKVDQKVKEGAIVYLLEEGE